MMISALSSLLLAGAAAAAANQPLSIAVEPAAPALAAAAATVSEATRTTVGQGLRVEAALGGYYQGMLYNRPMDQPLGKWTHYAPTSGLSGQIKFDGEFGGAEFERTLFKDPVSAERLQTVDRVRLSSPRVLERKTRFGAASVSAEVVDVRHRDKHFRAVVGPEGMPGIGVGPAVPHGFEARLGTTDAFTLAAPRASLSKGLSKGRIKGSLSADAAPVAYGRASRELVSLEGGLPGQAASVPPAPASSGLLSGGRVGLAGELKLVKNVALYLDFRQDLYHGWGASAPNYFDRVTQVGLSRKLGRGWRAQAAFENSERVINNNRQNVKIIDVLYGVKAGFVYEPGRR